MTCFRRLIHGRPATKLLVSAPNSSRLAPILRHETIFSGEFSIFDFQYQYEGNDDNNNDNKKYTNILHLNAAHGYDSMVSTAARELMDRLKIPFRLKEVDLWKQLPHYDCDYAASKLRILQGRGTAEDITKFEPVQLMAREINVVDVLVVSTPMWNYSVPYVLKQYIDIVIQPGINFKERRGEPPKAVRPARPLMLITSAGGHGSPDRDYLGPYLKLIFGLVGFDKFHHVNMCGLSQATSREEIFAQKAGEIREMAAHLEKYSKETADSVERNF